MVIIVLINAQVVLYLSLVADERTLDFEYFLWLIGVHRACIESCRQIVQLQMC